MANTFIDQALLNEFSNSESSNVEPKGEGGANLVFSPLGSVGLKIVGISVSLLLIFLGINFSLDGFHRQVRSSVTPSSAVIDATEEDVFLNKKQKELKSTSMKEEVVSNEKMVKSMINNANENDLPPLPLVVAQTIEKTVKNRSALGAKDWPLGVKKIDLTFLPKVPITEFSVQVPVEKEGLDKKEIGRVTEKTKTIGVSESISPLCSSIFSRGVVSSEEIGLKSMSDSRVLMSGCSLVVGESKVGEGEWVTKIDVVNKTIHTANRILTIID